MNKNYLNDEFDIFLGKVVRVDTFGHAMPVYGRLITTSPDLLTLERRDGHTTIIRKSAVTLIETVKNQGETAVV